MTTVRSTATAVDRDRQHDHYRGADQAATATRRDARLAGRNRREALGRQVVDVVRDDPAPLREPAVEVLAFPEQIVPWDVDAGQPRPLQGRTPHMRRGSLTAAAQRNVDHVASRLRRVRGRNAGTVAEAVRPGSTPTTAPALLGSGPTPAWR
ncbi:MAG: hypothetical protein JNM77_12940 [Pseudonocardia sp.]|nr:hypothetical protein [Pseudonocardia sp.]